MDTSETYIKMCDCPEIQKRKPYNDEYYFEFREGICHHGDFVSYQEGSIDIWLPRQDQWQDMGGLNVWQWGFKFSQWLYDLDDDGDCDFHVRHTHEDLHSHEQLAAGFVMKEKYDKVWNGEEWDVTVHNPRETPRTISPD